MCIFFVQFEKLYYFCIMKIKAILSIIIVILTAIICWLSADIARCKRNLADANELIEIQHEMIERLGSLDAVKCNIEVHLSNKTTFGNIKQSDINIVADQIQHYTRKQLLNDSTSWN